MPREEKLSAKRGSQTVRLPKKLRLIGKVVLKSPKDRAWETFMEGVGEFTDDYFETVEHCRLEEVPSNREIP